MGTGNNHEIKKISEKNEESFSKELNSRKSPGVLTLKLSDILSKAADLKRASKL